MALLLSTSGRNLEGLILSDGGTDSVGVEKSSAWPGDPAISCTFLFLSICGNLGIRRLLEAILAP